MSAPDSSPPDTTRVTADEAQALRDAAYDCGACDRQAVVTRLAETVLDLHAEVASQRDDFTRANVALAEENVALRLERDELRAIVATRYPRGKLTESDEGATQLAVGVVKDTVVVCFPKPVTWIGVDAATAEDLATKIRVRAQEARANAATPPPEGSTP